MRTPSLEQRDLTRDDLDAAIAVRNRSFGIAPPASLEGWRKESGELIDAGCYLGVFNDGRLVGAAKIRDFAQWWAGRRVPMAGIAAVVVAPEYRGRGVASLLMRGVLARSRELGYPISALYPATLPLYRGLGYEFGGARYRFSFPTAALRTLRDSDVTLRQGGPDDAERLLEIVARVRGVGRESGMLGWTEKPVREWLEEDETFCYLAEDGFVVYTWDGDNLRVDELVAGSEATARALWSVVGSGASTAARTLAFLSPQDPLHLMLGEEAGHDANVERWMLRLLDAPAAVAARGWTAGVEVDVAVEIEDREIAENAGGWRLQVSDGCGRLLREAASPGALRLTARGLAGWYAGTPLAALRMAGVASGGWSDDDPRLDAAVAGPTPYMLDYF